MVTALQSPGVEPVSGSRFTAAANPLDADRFVAEVGLLSGALASAAALINVGCAEEDPLSERNAELTAIPASWISVESPCGYRFAAPPDVTFQDVQGEDSCVDAWTTNGCVNGGDFGSFSSTLTEYKEYADYEATTEIIAGLPAKVVTASSTEGFLAAVHLPNVDDGALTVWAQCTDSAARGNALRSSDRSRSSAERGVIIVHQARFCRVPSPCAGGARARSSDPESLGVDDEPLTLHDRTCRSSGRSSEYLAMATLAAKSVE